MFPLYDKSAPRLSLPYVTLGLIMVNVLAFAYLALTTDAELVEKLVFIPSDLNDGYFLGLITAMFLHAGIIHLLGNMWFLWIFGDNPEENLGTFRYLLLYFASGIIASLTYWFLVTPENAGIPLVGASGAISGVLGSYLVICPKNKIRAFMLIFYYPLRFDVPAYFYLPIWFIYQFLYIGSATNVAFTAHIGGFLAGIVLALLLRRNIERMDFVVDADKMAKPVNYIS